MSLLPLKHTPLNQHSLVSLENWLTQLGAKKAENDPCEWILFINDCSVHMMLEKDSFKVTWEKEAKRKSCSFPYGLSREDIERAILEGL